MILSKNKRGVLDVISWNGQSGVLAYRHPLIDITKYSTLRIQESQEAIIVVNGVKSQKFGPGTYSLDSPMFPILKGLYGIPYEGQNPYQISVWFVNKLQPSNIDWSTDSFQVFDSDFAVSIPLCAKGRYGITVVDGERLILKIALGMSDSDCGEVSMTASDFTDMIYGELSAKVKSLITKVIVGNKISINTISAHLDDISNTLSFEINSFFEEYGCSLSKFYLTNIEVDVRTEIGKNVMNAISQQTAQKISGYTWQQEQVFVTAEKVIEGMASGTTGGLLGAVIATNMMGGLGGNMGSIGAGIMEPTSGSVGCTPVTQSGMSTIPQTQGIDSVSSPRIKEVYCSNCNKRYPTTSKFCPYCGNPYNPCPKCGTDNPENATRCISCGVSLIPVSNIVCSKCGKPISVGSSFCPFCGNPVADNRCPQCGCEILGTFVFCPQCGFNLK